MPIRNTDRTKRLTNASRKWDDVTVDMQTQDIGRLGLRKIGQRLRAQDDALSAPLNLDIEALLKRLDRCSANRPRTRRARS